ncbi:MAG: VOC family protein [Pseudomonadota bacterium]
MNYIEIPVTDVGAAKTFFTSAFGWSFIDYGPDYASFQEAGIDGGIYTSAHRPPRISGDDDRATFGPLIVLYANNLANMQAKIETAGGMISKSIFEFPGGKRFHFFDPSGNELAVWSDQ